MHPLNGAKGEWGPLDKLPGVGRVKAFHRADTWLSSESWVGMGGGRACAVGSGGSVRLVADA